MNENSKNAVALPMNIDRPEALLASVQTNCCALVTFKNLRRMFPGRLLDQVEHEFRKEFFSRTGQAHLRHGTSHEDQLLEFLKENRLNLRMLKHHYLIYRGRVDVESFVNSEL
jgi:hypothetical protein